jgi:hypothetical protein
LGYTHDNGIRPFKVDFGAHAAELCGMHIAILKHRFRDDRAPVGTAQQGHHLRLHVGGKTWIGCRGKIDWVGALAADDADPIVPDLDSGAGGSQMVEQRPEVCRETVINGDIATGHCPCDKERSPFNPIRDDVVCGGLQPRHSFDENA